jgi:integrase/recombinase XerD
MKWDCYFSAYLEHHCGARGLQPKTIQAYRETLKIFKDYIVSRFNNTPPDKVKTKDILGYVEYLRQERKNQDAAVNRNVTIIRNFYRALAAMEYLEQRDNPMAGFPKLKATKTKFKDTLSLEEVKKLINAPRTDTVMGVRDRAILVLLYGTGIRATECAGLKESDVSLPERIIRVIGKGGDQRIVPLNNDVALALEQYRTVRGQVGKEAAFFKSRKLGGRISRNAIYERVRKFARLSRIPKRVSPHTLRHTFATHLVRLGENLVVLRDLLGHRQITSTQRYLHMTAQDLRAAVDRHPIRKLIDAMKDYIPALKLPFQYPPGQRFVFGH